MVSNYNKNFFQLLLYIWGNSNISKNYIVNTIKLEFSLVFCKMDFMLDALRKVITNNIGRITIYTY